MAAASRINLLTGAAGFVGRQVLRRWRARLPRAPGCAGWQKKRSCTTMRSTIVAVAIFSPRAPPGGASLQRGRHGDPRRLVRRAGQYLQSPKNLDCLAGTLRLAEGAVEARVRRVVGIGTCFEYDLDVGRLSIRRRPDRRHPMRKRSSTPSKRSRPCSPAGPRVCLVPAVLSLRRRRGFAPARVLCARPAEGRASRPNCRAARRSATSSTCAKPGA